MAGSRTKVQFGPPADDAASTPVPIAADLLAWYDRHRRDLPWRAKPGESSDPYRVWLSEIMLQQTTVAAVQPFYRRFLERWPDVLSLAQAPLDAVLHAWAGLGYYSRARNLHACAQAVARLPGARFPDTEDALRALPGIGAYTAAAIAAIAFGRRAVVVDGNVERVMARLLAAETPIPAVRPRLRAAMDAVTPAFRAGDFAQAAMDLGATICTPKSPACIVCPIRLACRAVRTGNPAAYPRRLARKTVPVREGAIFYVEREDGRVLVRNRPPNGLFGGMTEFPGTSWTEDFDVGRIEMPEGIAGPIEELGPVHHGLTHFSLVLHVFRARAEEHQPAANRWVEPGSLHLEALPTLMRKVAERATE